MKALNIIESLYSGKPYQDSLNVRLDMDTVQDYELSRFEVSIDKLKGTKIEPYLIDFEEYKLLLSRVRLITNYVEVDLRLYSSEFDFRKVVMSYVNGQSVIAEPEFIDNLLYETDCGSFLSPLGILAFLFRKSYGNEKFKQFINSTILKQYYKVSIKNSPTFYFYKSCNEDMVFIKRMGDLLVTDRWGKIQDFLIQSPYIFSWRD